MAGGTQGTGIRRAGARPACPLDRLPDADREALRYAHWTGGRLFSDYRDSVALAQNADTDDTEEIHTKQQAIALGEGSAGVLMAATRDQSGNGYHFDA